MRPAKPVTKSQRRKATDQHHAVTPNRRKWYNVTVTRLNADGTTSSETSTASTGKVHRTAQYSRRGKELSRA